MIVELEQKKELLVEFAKGAPTDPALDKIQENTSGSSKKIMAAQEIRGGDRQPITVVNSLLPRIAEPAPGNKNIQRAIKKSSKKSTPKAKSVIPKEKPQKADQAEKTEVEKKIQSSQSKEDLNEARRNKGFFKGIRGAIINSFKKQGDKEERDRGILADQDEAKETGALALLGPLAPAIQEIKGLAGERDEEKESITSRVISKFRKKPVESEEEPEPEKEKAEVRFQAKARDESGKFISQKAERSVLPLTKPTEKVEESEITEKLDIIHNDLVSGDKDQKKRDKKNIRAIRGIEAGGGTGGPLGLPKKLLVGAAATAATAGIAMIAKDIYDIYKSFTTKGETGKKGGIEAVQAEDVGGVAGGVSGAIGGAKLGVMAGALTGPLAPFMVPILGVLGAGLGAIFGNVLGERLGKVMSAEPDETNPAAVKRQKVTEKKRVEATQQLGGYSSRIQSVKKGETSQSYMAEVRGYRYPTKQPATRSGARKTMPAVEDRSPKRVKQEKDIQKKTELSNKDLLTESKKTNELLDKLLNKKEGAFQFIKEDHISNGISNTSDLMSIKGLNE